MKTRPAGRLAATAATAALLAGLVAPSGAFAHGKLVSGSPKAGATVEAAPDRVVLTFVNEVTAPQVRVLDLAGRRLPVGEVPGKMWKVVVPLRGAGRGTHVVSWTARDDHGTAMRGAYVFHVGEPTAALAGATDLPAQRSGAVSMRELSDLGRIGVVVAAFAVLLAGISALLVPRQDRRARDIRLWLGAGATVMLALWSGLGLVASAGLASGTQGLLDTGAAEVGDLLAGTFGRLLAALFVASVLAAVSWRLATRRSPMGSAVLCTAAGVPVLLALGVAVSERPEAKPTVVERTASLPDGRSVRVRVEPGLAGANDLTVDVFEASGQPDTAVRKVNARLSHGPSSTGPYDVVLKRAGAGHFTLPGGTIPFPGQWRFEVFVSRDKFDQQRVAFDAAVSDNETLDRWLTSSTPTAVAG